jgi:hypothetical protein
MQKYRFILLLQILLLSFLGYLLAPLQLILIFNNIRKMKNFHLIHEEGKYKLKQENAERASKVFDSNKSDAIKASKDFILNQGGGSLKIHRNEGGFLEERTYPKSIDPRESKG